MFKDRLRELLKENEQNRQAFANAVGVEYGTVSNWLNKGTEPPYEILCKTADYFNVSTDYLLGRGDNILLKSENTELNVTKEIFRLVQELETLNDKQLETVKNFVEFEKSKKPAE